VEKHEKLRPVLVFFSLLIFCTLSSVSFSFCLFIPTLAFVACITFLLTTLVRLALQKKIRYSIFSSSLCKT